MSIIVPFNVNVPLLPQVIYSTAAKDINHPAAAPRFDQWETVKDLGGPICSLCESNDGFIRLLNCFIVARCRNSGRADLVP